MLYAPDRFTRAGALPPTTLRLLQGRSPNVPAPEIARRYWSLLDDATLRDVVVAVRADEAHHRDVNHGYTNELGGLPVQAVAPCPPHAALNRPGRRRFEPRRC